jgi:hypothetical protein
VKHIQVIESRGMTRTEREARMEEMEVQETCRRLLLGQYLFHNRDLNEQAY